jgi:hypothetical protein
MLYVALVDVPEPPHPAVEPSKRPASKPNEDEIEYACTEHVAAEREAMKRLEFEIELGDRDNAHN